MPWGARMGEQVVSAEVGHLDLSADGFHAGAGSFMSRRLDELAHCCHVAGKRHRKPEDFDDYYEARLGRLTDHGLRVLKPCSMCTPQRPPVLTGP